MRHVLVLGFVFCSLAVVSRAHAQDDAGIDSGPLESTVTDEVVPTDPVLSCLDSCTATHSMCVSTATFWHCVNNDPACAGVAPRGSQIIAAFCEACGNATSGCEADPSADGAEGTGGTTAPVVAPSAETEPRHRSTAEERERDALTRARGICTRQRGIWDAETVVRMPDGTERHGVCYTPEGAFLAQMIRDEHDSRVEADLELERLITTEHDERLAADRRHDDEIAIIHADDEAQDSRIAMLLAHFLCSESREDRIPLAWIAPPDREYLERDSGLVRDGHVECIHVRGHRTESGDTDEHESASAASTRRADEHPSAGGAGAGIHVRFQLLAGLFFAPLHPVLAIQRGEASSIPLSIGFDATVFGPLAHGWYAEGGGGLTYDAPDVPMYATNARVWYHAGLRVYVHPVVSIGFGYLGSDRFRSNLQSVHSFHGGYLDVSAHIRIRVVDRALTGSDDVTDPAIVFTLRGGAGASFRPIVSPAPDGLLQLLIGFEF